MTGWFGTPPGGLVPVTVVGYDGSPLPADARAAVDAADLVVGGERHLAAIGREGLVMGPLEPAVEALREAVSAGRRAVVLASGDPGLFGIVRRLAFENLPLTVLPARSSVATAFGRLGLPWDDAVVVSAHGRPLGPALNVIRRYAGTAQSVAVLTDAASSPAAIVEALGEDCPVLHVFERLGEADEQHTVVDGPPDRAFQHPNLVVVPAVPHDATWRLGARPEAVAWGLPDETFVHRDGMLTKREVRAVALSRLAPGPGLMVWDVGAGSGSVAAECARLGAATVAVEREPERSFLSDNVSGLGTKVVAGSAPEALKGLPHPDAVFVGGGGPEVVAAVAAVRPQRVVVALATLERLAPTVAALEGYDVDTILLQVSHLSPLGDGSRLAPANPVFLVSGALP